MRVENPMVMDCDTCPVRGLRCDDCVVTALGHLPGVVLTDGALSLDMAERPAECRRTWPAPSWRDGSRGRSRRPPSTEPLAESSVQRDRSAPTGTAPTLGG